ncbi:MAG: chemotaxis protein CheC [Chloroflexia bacterium]
MILSEAQKDGLTELLNIAFSRTAGALSELTGHRVLLGQPEVQICPVEQLGQVLEATLLTGEVATVHQIFGGALAGDALLILDLTGARALVELLTGEPVRAPVLEASSREVLVEVGNILLNSCLGMFGNILRVHVNFPVPRLHLNSLASLLDSLVIGDEAIRYALVVATQFALRDSEVGGYLVIVLGVGSLDRLLQEIERLG